MRAIIKIFLIVALIVFYFPLSALALIVYPFFKKEE